MPRYNLKLKLFLFLLGMVILVSLLVPPNNYVYKRHETSSEHVFKVSNFTLIFSKEWKNGSSSSPLISFVGTLGTSIICLGDIDYDEKIEIISASMDITETLPFNYKHQISLRLWKYSGTSLSLVKERVWTGSPEGRGYINAMRTFKLNNEWYLVTGGTIEYSSGGKIYGHADIRIWKITGNNIIFMSNYTWRHFTDKNSLIEGISVGNIDNDAYLEIAACGEITWQVSNNNKSSIAFLTLFKLNHDYTLSKIAETIVDDGIVQSTGFKDVEISNIDNDTTVEIIVGGYYGFRDSGVPRSKAYVSVWRYDTSLVKIREIQWFDMDSCGVLDIELRDMNNDFLKEIITGGVNKKYEIAGEIGILTYNLQLIKRRQFFINPGGSAGSYNWDCIVERIIVDDFDHNGYCEIVATGCSKGPPPPGYSGDTFWGYLASFNYLTLAMEASYYWLDNHASHVIDADYTDVDGDNTKEIFTIGYTTLPQGTIQYMYAKIWVWKYIITVNELVSINSLILLSLLTAVALRTYKSYRT